MTTADTTLLIVLTSLLCVYFLMCIVAVVLIIKLLNSLRSVVAKAEEVVDSVEEAAEVFKDTQGKLAIFKIVRNIVQLMQDKKRK